MDREQSYCITTKNYLLLQYRKFDDTYFICSFEGGLRLEVTRKKRNKSASYTTEGVYGFTDDEVFLFQNVGNPLLAKDEITDAINWYKIYIDEPEMRVIDVRDWLFYSVDDF